MTEKMNYYDSDLAAQAQAVLSSMGLDLEETVNSFLKEIVEKKAVPEQKKVMINPNTGEPFPPKVQEYFSQMSEEEYQERLEKARKVTHISEACGIFKGMFYWDDEAEDILEDFKEYI